MTKPQLTFWQKVWNGIFWNHPDMLYIPGQYYTRKELDVLLDGLTNHLFLARYIREENSK